MSMKSDQRSAGAPSTSTGADGDGLEAQVYACIADTLGVARHSLTPETTLIDVTDDSLGFMKVVFRLERVFGVRLDAHLRIPGPQLVSTYVDVVLTQVARR